MGDKPKIKKKDKGKIKKEDIEKRSFEFTHIKINYSFITTNKKYSFDNKSCDDKHRSAFLKRMIEISIMDFLKLSALPKESGFEQIEKKQVSASVDFQPLFYDNAFRKTSSEKITIFRLYPNNNPIPARFFGKMINKVFYLMGIELEHKLYK